MGRDWPFKFGDYGRLLTVTCLTFVFFLTQNTIQEASCIVRYNFVEAVSNLRATSEEVIVLQACTIRMNTELLVVVCGRLHTVGKFSTPPETL